MQKGLPALAVGAFGIGMTEFVMMGILPDVASSLQVSIPTAGHFITAYAMGVVVGAPLFTTLARKTNPKMALLIFMIWFTVFNSLSAFAGNYYIMLLVRFLSGLPHGAYFGIGSVVASKLAEKGKTAAAIAVMFSGLTIANIIGVPLGTYVGHLVDWRLTFGIVGLIGLATLFSIHVFLPTIVREEQPGLGEELSIMKKPLLWLILLLPMIGTGGLFAWYSYITPMLTEVAGFSSSQVIFILILVGVGMLCGNIYGAKLTDRFPPASVSFFVFSTFTCLLLLFVLSIHFKIAVLLFSFLIGAVALSTLGPITIMILKAAKGSEMLASSLSQAGFNVGNALGAYLGGLPLFAGYAYTSAVWVGMGMSLSGVIVSLLLIRDAKKCNTAFKLQGSGL